MDTDERYRCQLCGLIPKDAHDYNPFICTACGLRVCRDCVASDRHVHVRSPWEEFRKQHTPPKPTKKGKPERERHQSTLGEVDENDIPF